MKAIEGRDVLLELMSPNTGDYLPFVCAEDCSIRFGSSQLNATTKGDGRWEAFIMDRKNYSIELSGLIPATDESATGVTAFDLYSYYDNMTEVPFRMMFKDRDSNLIKVFLGNTYVTDLDFVGNAVDFAGSTASLRGNGAPSFQDNLLLCQAEIGSVSVSFQNELEVRFAFSGVVNSQRIEYSIDGGSRRVKSFTGNSGTIVVNPVQHPEYMVNGAHVVIFTPVCESGDDGEPFTLNYTKT